VKWLKGLWDQPLHPYDGKELIILFLISPDEELGLSGADTFANLHFSPYWKLYK
jgi:hypothetical protein